MSTDFAAGTAVYGPEGAIAVIRQVAVSPVSLEATWLVVDVVGQTHATAVPTTTASLDAAGIVRIPFTRAQLLAAPAVDDTVDGEKATALRRALDLA